MSRSKDRIPLTSDMITALRAEKDRTGVGAIALLKANRETALEGLKAPHIEHWLGGRVKTVDSVEYKFVLAAWKTLETAQWIDLTSELRAELIEAQKRSGITPEMIMRWGNDVPEGLTVGKIKAVLDGTSKSILTCYIGFLLIAWGLESD